MIIAKKKNHDVLLHLDFLLVSCSFAKKSTIFAHLGELTEFK